MIQDEPMTHHWHSTNLLVSDMTCLVGCRWISDSITKGIAQIINETAKDTHAIYFTMFLKHGTNGTSQ